MIDNLIAQLSEPEQRAVHLLKLSLDCFNSADGSGLFRGPERYSILQDRIALAAVQAQSLFDFWSRLLNKLLWASPPKEHDEAILTLLAAGDDIATIRVFADKAPSVTMLARYLHAQEKDARKEEKKRNAA